MNIIYYFTGTGNSLSVAKEIANGLGDCEIREITYGDTFVDIAATTVGIVYPVYCWGPPTIVADFISKAKFRTDSYIYCVATYGGMLARSNKTVANMFAARGLTLRAAFAIKMPGNYILMYDRLDDVKQRALFSVKDAKVTRIVDAVQSRKRGKLEKTLGLFGAWLSGSVYKKLMKDMKGFDAGFFVTDACTGCGVCVSVCPRANVSLAGGRPSWGGSCESCLACLHWCPSSAVQYGPKIASRTRYHNPEVTLKEISKR